MVATEILIARGSDGARSGEQSIDCELMGVGASVKARGCVVNKDRRSRFCGGMTTFIKAPHSHATKVAATR